MKIIFCIFFLISFFSQTSSASAVENFNQALNEKAIHEARNYQKNDPSELMKALLYGAAVDQIPLEIMKGLLEYHYSGGDSVSSTEYAKKKLEYVVIMGASIEEAKSYWTKMIPSLKDNGDEVFAELGLSALHKAELKKILLHSESKESGKKALLKGLINHPESSSNAMDQLTIKRKVYKVLLQAKTSNHFKTSLRQSLIIQRVVDYFPFNDNLIDRKIAADVLNSWLQRLLEVSENNPRPFLDLNHFGTEKHALNLYLEPFDADNYLLFICNRGDRPGNSSIYESFLLPCHGAGKVLYDLLMIKNSQNSTSSEIYQYLRKYETKEAIESVPVEKNQEVGNCGTANQLAAMKLALYRESAADLEVNQKIYKSIKSSLISSLSGSIFFRIGEEHRQTKSVIQELEQYLVTWKQNIEEYEVEETAFLETYSAAIIQMFSTSEKIDNEWGKQRLAQILQKALDPQLRRAFEARRQLPTIFKEIQSLTVEVFKMAYPERFREIMS